MSILSLHDFMSIMLQQGMSDNYLSKKLGIRLKRILGPRDVQANRK